MAWLLVDNILATLTGNTMLQRVGRSLLNNDLIFDFGAWAYAWMTDNAVWRENCAQLLEGIPITERQAAPSILDLGAGPGNSAVVMASQEPTAHVIACDLAPKMLWQASQTRRQAKKIGHQISLLQADAYNIPLVNNSVDVVAGHSFLYLLPDYRHVLGEAWRVLKPGGHVAFLEPAAGQMKWGWLLHQRSTALSLSFTLWRLLSWFHRRFSPIELKGALAESGFGDVTSEPTLGGFGIFCRGRKLSEI